MTVCFHWNVKFLHQTINHEFFKNCCVLWGQFISNTLTVTCLTVKLLSHVLCTSGPLYETFHKLWITRYNHMYLINFLGTYKNEGWRGSCPVVGFVISCVWLLEFCYHTVSFSISIQCSVQWLCMPLFTAQCVNCVSFMLIASLQK
jgi:hypothetical protein